MESTNAEDVANSIVSKNNTQTSQIQELQKEVSKLRKTIVEQDQKNEMLTKNQTAQERYSRKDSVLIVNPPFDSRSVHDVTLETLKFFDKFLGVYLERPSIKACHIVPGQLKKNNMPTNICKFIYFADQKKFLRKDEPYETRKTQSMET